MPVLHDCGTRGGGWAGYLCYRLIDVLLENWQTRVFEVCLKGIFVSGHADFCEAQQSSFIHSCGTLSKPERFHGQLFLEFHARAALTRSITVLCQLPASSQCVIKYFHKEEHPHEPRFGPGRLFATQLNLHWGVYPSQQGCVPSVLHADVILTAV